MTGADVEVAIVGGGAAGIGAARRLREAASGRSSSKRATGSAAAPGRSRRAVTRSTSLRLAAFGRAQSVDEDRRGAGPDDRPHPAAVGARGVAAGTDGRRVERISRRAVGAARPRRRPAGARARPLPGRLARAGRAVAGAARRRHGFTAAPNSRASRRATSAATPTTASTGALSKATARPSPSTAPTSTSPSIAPSRASTIAGGAFASRRRAESSQPTRRSSPCRAR